MDGLPCSITITMASQARVLSLQEPLIPFTWPARDDPGWDIFEESNEQADGASSHSSHRHEGSEGTSLLMDETNELAVVETSGEEGGAVSRQDETPEDTLRRICKAARQPALELEDKASKCRAAARNALQEGNHQGALEYCFQAATYDQEATEAHRKAACIIYAANNENLPPDTIDLRGLRASELHVIRNLLQTRHPALPAYRFILDPDEREPRDALEAIARSLHLPHYRDGRVTCIIVRDRTEYFEERLIAQLRQQAEDSHPL